MHSAFLTNPTADALVLKGETLVLAHHNANQARIAAIQQSRRDKSTLEIHLRWRREPEVVTDGEFTQRRKWK